ncbi:MAG: hypothetical protein QM767_19730 [Anaeromyxobacter sp.]
MTRPAVDPLEIRNRIFGSVCLTSFPSSIVVGYLIAISLGFSWSTTALSTSLVLVPMVSLAMAFEYVAATVLTRSAFDAPGDPERLRRLLELPRRMEVLPYTLGWTAGGAAYTVAAAMIFGGPVERLWLGAIAGLFAALFLGPILAIRCEEHLRPAVLEIALRNPGVRPTGSGPFWVRQRWYLPYAFCIALLTLVAFAGITVVVKWRSASDRLLALLAGDRFGDAADVVRAQLGGLEVEAGLPVLGLLLILLVAFGITGAMLARREARAAAEVEAALRAIAAGAPRLPHWTATDEMGISRASRPASGSSCSTPSTSSAPWPRATSAVSWRGRAGSSRPSGSHARRCWSWPGAWTRSRAGRPSSRAGSRATSGRPSSGSMARCRRWPTRRAPSPRATCGATSTSRGTWVTPSSG